MIKLDVDPWCADCPEFEARVEKDSDVYTDYYFEAGDKHLVFNTWITCKNRIKCNCIRFHIEKNQSSLKER